MIARPDLSGRALCVALSDVADAWLCDLLGAEPGVALVAVGGYGRRELCPQSDLDLVLVHCGRKDVAALAERIWYPVWDSGVALDHSVRTVPEALAVAGADLKAALGLLDARHVAGDRALTGDLLRRLREQWRRRAPKALGELAESVLARHARAGEVAFLLEPDLKEARGGLRDLAAMRAAAAGWAVDAPRERTTAAYDVLLAARCELHRATGRATDVLALQEQDAVASALGYADPVELMSAVGAAGRTVAYDIDETMRRVGGWLRGGRRRLTRPIRPVPVAPGVARHDAEIVLAVGTNAVSDPALPWRVAAASATTGLPISTASLERLAAETPAPPRRWPDAMREALVAVLASGRPGIGAIEALDQHDLVDRALPEWAAVRSRSQRNPYHRFTVDRHLCETAANAATLRRAVRRPDLLLVGAWLHDIGKGFPGDHTDAGVAVVSDVAARMGFGAEDVAVLVAMVRHHLLLPDVATRRDLDDPATVDAVAAAVGSRDVLDLLAALCEADGLATGPSAWSDWKAELVAELVRRTARVLGGLPADPGPGLLQRHADAVAEARTSVTVTDAVDRVVVVAKDAPGLLWRVAGAIALHRVDVRSATLASADGVAVQEIVVAPSYGSAPEAARIADDVRRAVEGRLALDSRLAERARAYARPARLPGVPPRVVVDNDASRSATVVEVRAADEVGVLYRIARALSDSALDVRSAKVVTIGPEVVDTFYVVGSTGAKVTDPEHLAEVARSVLDQLTR